MSRYDELLKMIEVAGVAINLGALGQGFEMEQSPSELARFLSACEACGVQSMLELGTGEFGGLARFCYTKLHWSVTSIDHRVPVYESGRFILGETSDADVYRQVKDLRFDLVFIDADHHDYSVKRDYEMYAPLATKIVALHDVAPGREGTQGVAAFWNEILQTTGAGGIDTLIDPNNPIGIGYYKLVQAEQS